MGDIGYLEWADGSSKHDRSDLSDGTGDFSKILLTRKAAMKYTTLQNNTKQGDGSFVDKW